MEFVYARGSKTPQVEFEFGSDVFVEGKKPKNLAKKHSERGQEPTTNSTAHMKSMRHRFLSQWVD